MFSNLIIYRIGALFDDDLSAIEQALAKTPFTPCGPTQEHSAGWVPPRGEDNGALIESIGGQWIARFFTESKSVPADVMARKLKEMAAHIEQTEGRKSGRMELKELREEINLAMLPVAFAKQSAMWVWIDREARMLVLDTSSQGRADEVVTALVSALPGLTVSLIDTQTSPQAAMAHWLREQEPPAGFTIDRECELKGCESTVKYGRHPLDIAEIREHIDQGKLPTKLAMTWDDRVSFVLTEGMQLKKVELLGVVMEGQNQADAGFDADVAIATGELTKLIPGLIEALDGEGRTELGQLP